MNSGTVLAGNDGLTSSTPGERDDTRNRHDVAGQVEGELVVKSRIDGVRDRNLEVAYNRWAATYERLGGDIAARTRSIFHDELLAKTLRQPLRHQARYDVGDAAGGKTDQQAHRPRWIGLAPKRSARRPATRQRPRPDAEIADGEVS